MRHNLSKEIINVDNKNLQKELNLAEKLEAESLWQNAAEAYIQVAELLKQQINLKRECGIAYARAANCFEISGQKRDAALAYFESGTILHINKLNLLYAGELYNRAALNYRSVYEYFNSGDCYQRAAQAFHDFQEDIVVSEDNIPPVPSSAGKFTISADCYNAAAEMFVKADNLAWARSSYWQAGEMHIEQGYGYHAYVAFRNALITCIKFDNTHDLDQLLKALPLSDDKRTKRINPIKIMEESAYQGNLSHQQINQGILSMDWVAETTEKQIIGTYHDFYLNFLTIGNQKEADYYFVEEKKRLKSIFLRQNKYFQFTGYQIWELTCNYGTSFKRWGTSCLTIFLGFGVLYNIFDAIAPVNHLYDYFYFSLVTMTTLGYGDIHPNNLAGKISAPIEAIMGWLMLGFLLTLINNILVRK